MGAQIAGKAASHGGRRRRAYRPMADINMTPFIDVMLVLLIVFMVAAPLLTVGVPVDLPKTNAQPLEAQKDPIYITVQADGKIFIQETEVAFADLVPKIQAMKENKQDLRVYVRGASALNYGTIMKVMGALSEANIAKVGLVTEPTGAAPAAGKPSGHGKPTGR